MTVLPVTTHETQSLSNEWLTAKLLRPTTFRGLDRWILVAEAESKKVAQILIEDLQIFREAGIDTDKWPRPIMPKGGFLKMPEQEPIEVKFEILVKWDGLRLVVTQVETETPDLAPEKAIVRGRKLRPDEFPGTERFITVHPRREIYVLIQTAGVVAGAVNWVSFGPAVDAALAPIRPQIEALANWPVSILTDKGSLLLSKLQLIREGYQNVRRVYTGEDRAPSPQHFLIDNLIEQAIQLVIAELDSSTK